MALSALLRFRSVLSTFVLVIISPFAGLFLLGTILGFVLQYVNFIFDLSLLVENHLMLIAFVGSIVFLVLLVVIRPPYLLGNTKLGVTIAGASLTTLTLISYFNLDFLVAMTNGQDTKEVIDRTIKLGLLPYTVGTLLVPILIEVITKGNKEKAKHSFYEALNLLDQDDFTDEQQIASNTNLARKKLIEAIYYSSENYEPLVLAVPHLRAILISEPTQGNSHIE